MVSCSNPFSDASACLLETADCEIDQLCRGIVGWEAATRFGGFADDPIEAFDRIGGVDDFAAAPGPRSDDIPITAPASGRILRIMQQSEITLPAGTPIMEIGDVTGDLEVVVELLSTDAVQVAPGNRVIIDDWGGTNTLDGEVVRVDPFGISKFSALGVEEQRVSAVIRFTSPANDYPGLGHGFRVEARIVVWEDANTLILPASALFRDKGEWAVFSVENGAAALRQITLGQNNGIDAQVLDGLVDGDTVVLFPYSGIADGMSVAHRVIN